MTVRKDILATLAYYDIFNYPLTRRELFLFLGNSSSPEIFLSEIRDLLKKGLIYKLDEFYSLQNDFSLIERRKNGNAKAKSLLRKADLSAEILSRFPFVKGVAVSGSLSKNFAEDDSDIDFFIITTANRLWLCRTFLHLFKKFMFLLRKEHYFCMNYFIDEANLEIEEKNLYTATEIITLMPLRGIKAFELFFERNSWIHSFLPNHTMKVTYVREMKDPLYKRFTEVIFLNKIGEALDHILMFITSKRWQKKETAGRKNNHGETLSMITQRHCSKPNPLNFQKKILLQHEHKLFNIYERTETAMKAIH